MHEGRERARGCELDWGVIIIPAAMVRTIFLLMLGTLSIPRISLIGLPASLNILQIPSHRDLNSTLMKIFDFLDVPRPSEGKAQDWSHINFAGPTTSYASDKVIRWELMGELMNGAG